MLSSCTPDNSRFYVDITSNKKICFNDDLDCPNGYKDYNETSRECKYSMALNDEIGQMIDNDLIKKYLDLFYKKILKLFHKNLN